MGTIISSLELDSVTGKVTVGQHPNLDSLRRVSGTGGDVRRRMPGGAEVIVGLPGAGAADIDEVEAVGEVAGLVRRLARDLHEVNKAADVGEHYCETRRSD
jgi:hypothetical protein